VDDGNPNVRRATKAPADVQEVELTDDHEDRMMMDDG